MKSRALLCLILCAAAVFPLAAQIKPKTPDSMRMYVFQCGTIKGRSVTTYGFKEGEVPPRDFVVTCYLIVHPKGILMWDTGLTPDAELKPDSGTKPLKVQLGELGYSPMDITYLAMSHYHSDHTANSNDFASATWIVQKAERDAMFGAAPVRIITLDCTSSKPVVWKGRNPVPRSPAMIITLDLQPEIEQGLVAQAHLRGVSLIEYAQEVLAREAKATAAPLDAPASEAKNLYELFAPVRGLLTDEEVDTLFRRNQSSARPVNLE
jgi:ribonuclease BN (tRNA processing enzyme)